MSNVHGEGNHKLELLETGKMSYGGMLNQIEQVFDINPRKLEIMRLDVAADIHGIPVSWFLRRMRVQWKQFAAEIGDVDYVQMGKREIQTFYLGKRPNFFRIYNKIAERIEQYKKLARKLKRSGIELPTFEQVFGHLPNAVILTRVERQMAGGRVPYCFSTVKDLKKAPDFDPFDRLEIIAPGHPQPTPEQFGLVRWLTGMQIRETVEQMGIHLARSFFNKQSPGHANRLLREYKDFLPSADPGVSEITVDHLRESYRNSVQRQLR